MSARFYYSSLIPPPPLLLYQRVLYYVHYFEYLNFIHNNNSDLKKIICENYVILSAFLINTPCSKKLVYSLLK